MNLQQPSAANLSAAQAQVCIVPLATIRHASVHLAARNGILDSCSFPQALNDTNAILRTLVNQMRIAAVNGVRPPSFIRDP